MDNKFSNGAKYFSNVRNILDSIKSINVEDKLNAQIIKSLCSILDTQNDILKYMMSYDENVTISKYSKELSVNQFVYVESENSYGIIKEVLDTVVSVYIIDSGLRVNVSKEEF